MKQAVYELRRRATAQTSQIGPTTLTQERMAAQDLIDLIRKALHGGKECQMQKGFRTTGMAICNTGGEWGKINNVRKV
jgi:hypothetical protein